MGFLYGPMGFPGVFRSAEVVASIMPGPVGLDASVDGRGLRLRRRQAAGEWTVDERLLALAGCAARAELPRRRARGERAREDAAQVVELDALSVVEVEAGPYAAGLGGDEVHGTPYQTCSDRSDLRLHEYPGSREEASQRRENTDAERAEDECAL